MAIREKERLCKGKEKAREREGGRRAERVFVCERERGKVR